MTAIRQLWECLCGRHRWVARELYGDARLSHGGARFIRQCECCNKSEEIK